MFSNIVKIRDLNLKLKEISLYYIWYENVNFLFMKWYNYLLIIVGFHDSTIILSLLFEPSFAAVKVIQPEIFYYLFFIIFSVRRHICMIRDHTVIELQHYYYQFLAIVVAYSALARGKKWRGDCWWKGGTKSA